MVVESHCTTWHVRVDMMDGGEGVVARAELVGAPRAMAATGRTHPHDGCLGRCPDIEYLSTWQAVAELAPALVDALELSHRVGFGAADGQAPVSRSSTTEPRPSPDHRRRPARTAARMV